LPAKNAENRYKLEMGDLGFTDVISLFYTDFGQSNHARLTDAANGTIALLVDNAQQEALTLQLLDNGGHVVHTQQTNESTLHVNTKAIERGVYVYRINGAGVGTITGRFAVVR